MPNHKSAEKRMRQTEKRRVNNRTSRGRAPADVESGLARPSPRLDTGAPAPYTLGFALAGRFSTVCPGELFR